MCARQPWVKSLEHSRKMEKQVVEVATQVLGSKEFVEPLGIALSVNSVTTPGCPSSDTSPEIESMDSADREMTPKIESRTHQEQEFLNLANTIDVPSMLTRENPVDADTEIESMDYAGGEMSARTESRAHQEEPFLNLANTIDVSSMLTRENPDDTVLCYIQSSSLGSKDLDKSSLTHCSNGVEDACSVELTQGAPTNSVSSIDLSIGAAAADSLQPGTNSVDCHGKEENGAWNNQDKKFQLLESSNDCITENVAHTNGVPIATFSAHDPRELTSLTFSSGYSELKLEHVISCYPSISVAGLGNGDSNGFVECDSTQNCTSSKNLSISSLSPGKDSSDPHKDEAARKGPSIVEIACNGSANPLHPHENSNWVVSHDRNCEDVSSDLEKPINYDGNDKNPAEVARACKLNTNCNGYVDSVVADLNVVRTWEEDEVGNGAVLDCKNPLNPPYSRVI